MILTELLTYLGNTTTFPFFGGWVAPSGSGTTLVVEGVTLDVITGAPSGDKWLRGYYRKVQGHCCDTTTVAIYVVAYGTESESAYLRTLTALAAPAEGVAAKDFY